MDNLNKLGDINNVNDFLDFKLSIKTILVIVFFWGVICFFVFLFMVGGINNAIDFIKNMIGSTNSNIKEAKAKDKDKEIVKKVVEEE